MYWGTPKENLQDQIEAGTHSSFKDRMIKKYGLDIYREMMSKAGSLGGKANRGVPKSEEHKRKISQAVSG